MTARLTRRAFIGAAATGLLAFGNVAPLPAAETSELRIVTADGSTHRFSVELAVTPEQKARGLMFRRRLAADAGMLFLYDPPERAAIWMKNTYIPLDIIFVAPDGRILNISERAVPMSLNGHYAAGRAAAVLEVNGGTASRLGIAPGDQVEHPALPAAGG